MSNTTTPDAAEVVIPSALILIPPTVTLDPAWIETVPLVVGSSSSLVQKRDEPEPEQQQQMDHQIDSHDSKRWKQSSPDQQPLALPIDSSHLSFDTPLDSKDTEMQGLPAVDSTSRGFNVIDLTWSPPPLTAAQQGVLERKKAAHDKLIKARAARERERIAAEKEVKDEFGRSHLKQYGIFTTAGPGAGLLNDTSDAKLDPRRPFVADVNCTDQQRAVLDAVAQGRNVFVTGSAGVGKSMVIAEIDRLLKSLGKRFKLCATTGIAAVNIGGVTQATTLHSWASMGLADKSIELLYTDLSKKKLSNYLTTDVLIIDEISMVNCDFFTKLNVIAKLIRTSNEPFGGIQLIICGDFFQLPPVPNRRPKCIRCNMEGSRRIEPAKSTLPFIRRPGGLPDFDIRRCDNVECRYEFRDRRFIFETDVFAECNFMIMELTKVFRQSDVPFISALESIRRGDCTQEHIRFFESCGSALKQKENIAILPTNLFPMKKEVEQTNEVEFNKLKSKPYAFKAVDQYRGDKIREEHKKLTKQFPAIRMLNVKKGCQVILLINLSQELGLVNGSRGVIVDWKDASGNDENKNDDSDGGMALFKKRSGMSQREEASRDAEPAYLKEQNQNLVPEVYFANGVTRIIHPWLWTTEIDQNNSVGTIQIPLALGWALTIHKSQGQSLDAVAVRLNSAFEYGQAYVALSRARRPEGMIVTGLHQTSVKADPSVKAFYNAIKAGRSYYDSIAPVHIFNYLPEHSPARVRTPFLPPCPPPLPIGSAISGPPVLLLSSSPVQPDTPARLERSVFPPSSRSSTTSDQPLLPSSSPMKPEEWHILLQQAAVAYATTTQPLGNSVRRFGDTAEEILMALLNVRNPLPSPLSFAWAATQAEAGRSNYNRSNEPVPPPPPSLPAAKFFVPPPPTLPATKVATPAQPSPPAPKFFPPPPPTLPPPKVFPPPPSLLPPSRFLPYGGPSTSYPRSRVPTPSIPFTTLPPALQSRRMSKRLSSEKGKGKGKGKAVDYDEDEESDPGNGFEG